MQIRMHRNSCCKSRACHLASPWQQKSGTTDADTSPSPRRNPKNRKALQKIFQSPKPKLLGFVDKVWPPHDGARFLPLFTHTPERTGTND